jgi:ATPase subunit of ABC transporter with duplicated ATPase domains
MSHQSVIFHDVSFTYDTAVSPLLEGFSAHFPSGWTGVVGANGSGKSTILKLAVGELIPRAGKVDIPDHAIYCPQRTDEPPPMFGGLLEGTDAEAYKTRSRLGIGDDWLERWRTLSHGERKRAQIGTALWLQPQVLAVDEPTNHLDSCARDMLMAALLTFKGAGLLVSHDRELLDALCRQCLFLEPPEAVMRPGNYSKGFDQAQKDETYHHDQRLQAKREISKLKRSASRHRNSASQADRKRSKRGLAVKDHDARSKLDLARLTGKDGTAGKRLRQLDGRMRQAREKLDQIKVKKNYETGIWLPGSRSECNTLFDLAGGSLLLGGERRLYFPDIVMRPGDRIALTGPNGSGKSTLICHIMEVLDTSGIRVTYMPQEIDVSTSRELMDEVRCISNEKKGHMMTIVSRLGSRPHRLLESREPSPGEVRKLLLAMGITDEPNLIVMDEPTNHLDLPSIRCLESALSDCPCGLLLVSHDRPFLSALTRIGWHINKRDKHGEDYELSIL